MEILYAEPTNEKIEEKRKEMIRLAIEFGFTSQLTVRASQELDSLLNAVTVKNKTYTRKSSRKLLLKNEQ